ncbi:MAG: diaminopimelate epimerase [Alistipes sp.]|nr:diaminopimelate epimerase [Alistipes sp.]
MQTAFSKYEGAGNDFILIDDRQHRFRPEARLVARLCDRHFGIGADGLMTLTQTPDGGCVMRYFNADGSEGEMCGNGARCFALFVRHLGLCGDTCRFEATDGAHTAQLRRVEGPAGEIELGMIDVAQIRTGDGWWSLNTGVPHYVEFVDDPSAVDVCGRGRAIRRDTARFPQGTNVNFVQILGPGRLRMRTYERGVENETLACGTGATAAAIVACHARQHDCRAFRIEVPGGVLSVRFDRRPDTQHYTDVRLTGPARRVFGGTFDTDDL